MKNLAESEASTTVIAAVKANDRRLSEANAITKSTARHPMTHAPLKKLLRPSSKPHAMIAGVPALYHPSLLNSEALVQYSAFSPGRSSSSGFSCRN